MVFSNGAIVRVTLVNDGGKETIRGRRVVLPTHCQCKIEALVKRADVDVVTTEKLRGLRFIDRDVSQDWHRRHPLVFLHGSPFCLPANDSLRRLFALGDNTPFQLNCTPGETNQLGPTSNYWNPQRALTRVNCSPRPHLAFTSELWQAVALP